MENFINGSKELLQTGIELSQSDEELSTWNLSLFWVLTHSATYPFKGGSVKSLK